MSEQTRRDQDPQDDQNSADSAPPEEQGQGSEAPADQMQTGEAAADAEGGADRTAQLEAEAAELKDRWVRTAAELENVRRRAERDKQDAANYAITRFARDILTVADYLRMALESIPADVREDGRINTLITGVELTEKELLSGFDRHGIEPVTPAKGDAFDPNRHQAMNEVETDEVPPGKVYQVIKSGYVLKDRLLRAAMVAVAKAPAGSRGDGEPGASVDQAV